jgi:hypothetical protein
MPPLPSSASSVYEPKTRGFGHCIEPSWSRDPSPDLAAVLLRAAMETTDAGLATRLRERGLEAASAVPPRARAHPTKTHARIRALPFLIGGLDEALEGLTPDSASLTPEALEPRLHLKGPLAETHDEDTAIGLVASVAAPILDAARFAGDAAATAAGLRLVDRMKRFDGGVPRGAQTWEVPLHTPDILASARAVDAFVSAYELTGDPEHLKRARYWAATGLPFVYTWSSKERPIQRFATTPVFGATNYVAPNWIGLPVQWCGLCYAESLDRFIRYASDDDRRLFGELADGIVACAGRMLVPDGPAKGCLPDSFTLTTQTRNGPMINPGSALAQSFPRMSSSRIPLLDTLATPRGRLIHAPGALSLVSESESSLVFRFTPPTPKTPPPTPQLWRLAVIRPGPVASVTVDGAPLPPADSTSIDAAPGFLPRPDPRRLLLTLPSGGEVSVALKP